MARATADGTSEKAAGRLSAYRRKRRFDASPEPAGESDERGREDQNGAADRRTGAGGRFVVHEHHARRLHWDLRLERDGVLVSWAIPNGIPEDPSHNRRAVRVEDHPVQYIDFEGTIPKGSYGAGEVRIWDEGSYRCEKWEQEKVLVRFDGRRLRGRYALFKAGKQDEDWMIHLMDPPADSMAQRMPEMIDPMLAQLSGMPSDDSAWAFEIKWDGVRAIARSEPGRIRLFTRNHNDVTAAYPELRGLNAALGSSSAILDGEIVALDEHGRSSFQALQRRMHVRGQRAIAALVRHVPVTYVIFDLLWLNGHSLTSLPYLERRKQLQALNLASGRWIVPGYHLGDGPELLAASRAQGLEGLIAKRLDSPYTPGRRDGRWLKLKNSRRQEMLIGGFTQGKGARGATIGALELGFYDERGQLRYAGRVGTGFDEAELEMLARMLTPLQVQDSPFTGRQPSSATSFVRPQLVCEVEFSEWTKDGSLRHPSYRGLREDKPPSEVRREHVQAPASLAPHAAGQDKPPSEVRREHVQAPASLAPHAAGKQESGSRAQRTRRSGSSRRSSTAAASLESILSGARSARGGLEVEVEGRKLTLRNLEKVLYPRTGFTKAQLIGFYVAIAPCLLPHLQGRPLTLKRYPNGVEGAHFYQKQSPNHRPDWVQTAKVWSSHSKREIEYTLCEDLPTLVWLANLADVELHPSLSLASAMQRPTAIALDLDPGPPADILACCEVALAVRRMLEQLGLRSFPKTSGSKGMQVYVPLNEDAASYESTKPLAHELASHLAQRRSDLVVSRMTKTARAGRVLLDWSQNDQRKTTVSVYSLRALDAPTVSTPVRWEEVRACLEAEDPSLLTFQAPIVLDRVRQDGDLFAQVLTLRQSTPSLEQARSLLGAE